MCVSPHKVSHAVVLEVEDDQRIILVLVVKVRLSTVHLICKKLFSLMKLVRGRDQLREVLAALQDIVGLVDEEEVRPQILGIVLDVEEALDSEALPQIVMESKDDVALLVVVQFVLNDSFFVE
jgi:hypothetical protein